MIKVHSITNGNVYVDGDSYLGRAKEFELPEIVQKTIDHEGLGMVGVVELFAGIDKLEAKVMWNSYYPEAIAKFANAGQVVPIQVRGSMNIHNSEGIESQVPVVCFMNVLPKSLGLGTFKQHESVEAENSLSVLYVKLEIDGVTTLELDLVANIYKVEGVDILADYKRNLGV